MANRNGALLFSTLLAFTLLSGTSVFSSPDNTALTIKLTLPDNSQSIYIPGTGYLDPDSRGNWTNPPHYFISSQGNGIVYSLIHGYQYPLSLGLESTPQNHTLVLNQTITNSNAFLVFSQGNWETVQNRMLQIETGSFLKAISPTFGYGLGTEHPIKILLKVPEADLDSSLIIRRGNHELKLSYIDILDNRTVLHPERV